MVAAASVAAGVHIAAGVHVAVGVHVVAGIHAADVVHDAAHVDADGVHVAVAARSSRLPPRWRRPTAVSAGSSRPFSSADRAIAVIPRPPHCGSCSARRSAVPPSFGIWHAPTAVGGCTANNNTTATPPDRPLSPRTLLVGIVVRRGTILT